MATGADSGGALDTIPSGIQETWLEEVRWMGDRTAVAVPKARDKEGNPTEWEEVLINPDLFRWRLQCGWLFWMGMDPDRVPRIGARFWWEDLGDGRAVIYVPYTTTEAGTPVYFPWRVREGRAAYKLLANTETRRAPMSGKLDTNISGGGGGPGGGERGSTSNGEPITGPDGALLPQNMLHHWAAKFGPKHKAMLRMARHLYRDKGPVPPLGGFEDWIMLLGDAIEGLAGIPFAVMASDRQAAQETAPQAARASTHTQPKEHGSQASTKAPRANVEERAVVPVTLPGFDNEAEGYADLPSASTKVSPSASEATEKQLKAIYAIGWAARHMTEQDVEDWSVEVFGVTPNELTKAEASEFIDRLKKRAGEEEEVRA